MATLTDSPVTVVGVAASSGSRLRSWDRFLVPAPGATVFVSLAGVAPDQTPGTGDIQAALEREVARCEQGGPGGSLVQSARGRTAGEEAGEGPLAGSSAASRTCDEGAALARTPTPGPVAPSTGGASGEGAGSRLRRRPRHPSTGSTTSASSPRIPPASPSYPWAGSRPEAAARRRSRPSSPARFRRQGHRPAILARGYADELDLLAHEAPEPRSGGTGTGCAQGGERRRRERLSPSWTTVFSIGASSAIWTC